MNNAVKTILFATVLVVNGFSDDGDLAYVPVKVNVAATLTITPPDNSADAAVIEPSGGTVTVAANTTTTLTLRLGSGPQTNAAHRPRTREGAPATISYGRGGVYINLHPRQYANAEISMFTVNGKRVAHNRISAGNGTQNISRQKLSAGVYLLSIKGADGNKFSSRLNHNGGNLNISVSFGRGTAALEKSAAIPHGWTITAVPTGTGHLSAERIITPLPGTNEEVVITLAEVPAAKATFNETVNGVEFKMIYVEGGSFTFGALNNDNPNVTVTDYYIGETEVTNAMWWAVMGNRGGVMTSAPPANNSCQNFGGMSFCTGPDMPVTGMTWYDANEFVCRLSQLTGKSYRLPTEAEWEFAAKGGKNGNHSFQYSGSNTESEVSHTGSGATTVKSKNPNQLGTYDMTGNVEEWTYDTYVMSYNGSGTNPIMGVNGHIHTQKARRGGYYGEYPQERRVITRRIRSIEGSDASLGMRIALSDPINTIPANMRDACKIVWPHANDGEVKNGWRDMRLVTGSDSIWQLPAGTLGYFNNPLRLWADGTAMHGSTAGQWYTVNNMVLKFVPNSSGERIRYPYIFVDLDEPLMSVITPFTTLNFGGTTIAQPPSAARLEKARVTFTGTKPTTVTPLDQLHTDAEDVMVDMRNPPTNQQDSRLLNGNSSPTDNTWWQDPGAVGAHHYYKVVTPDRFVFYVCPPGMDNMLAGGTWFTVNNTFLRVTSSSGYETDYLYSVYDDTFIHASFQMYERGDYRTFKMTNNDVLGGNNNGTWQYKGAALSNAPTNMVYQNHRHGHSTYEPPLPPDGGY